MKERTTQMLLAAVCLLLLAQLFRPSMVVAPAYAQAGTGNHSAAAAVANSSGIFVVTNGTDIEILKAEVPPNKEFCVIYRGTFQKP